MYHENGAIWNLNENRNISGREEINWILKSCASLEIGLAANEDKVKYMFMRKRDVGCLSTDNGR